MNETSGCLNASKVGKNKIVFDEESSKDEFENNRRKIIA
jgi:hypothetical protein